MICLKVISLTYMNDLFKIYLSLAQFKIKIILDEEKSDGDGFAKRK